MHQEGEGCERACYDCLMDYENQPDHPFLNRHLVLPFFAQLAQATFEEKTAPEGLKALLTQCQSELERRWLWACHERGLPLPDQAQYTLEVGPTFTRFDFFYDRGLGIYVDGPPHQDPERAQKDQEIREALTLMGVPFLVFAEGQWDQAFAELEAQLLGSSQAWEEALLLVDPPFRPLLEALRAKGLRPPDAVGEDLMREGRVVGQGIARWGSKRLVPEGMGGFGLEVGPESPVEAVLAYLGQA